MKNARRRFGVAALVALIASGLVWYRLAPGEPPAGQPALVRIDVGALEALKSDFNRSASEVRLILLLSPT